MKRVVSLAKKINTTITHRGGLLFRKSEGIDGLLVTVGLCIIALLLCVVMKDKLAVFIETVVNSLTTKAVGILG